jgi:pyrroline-5-carboxylate reductase
MSKIRLTVIGGGQMGRALVGGMLARKVVSARGVLVVEPDSTSRSWWQQNHEDVTVIESPGPAVADSDIVLLAVKPQVVQGVLASLPKECREKLIVSIAAGVSLTKLSTWCGHGRVIRVMPNTPSLVGEGASAYCGGDDVSAEDYRSIDSMLSSVGVAYQVNESQIDAVTGLSGSGPAYVCMIIEALADGGVMEGLSRPLAMQLATQTVLGTARMIQQTGKHPGELKDAVASPGGTTIAAIASLEQNGLRGALIEAVRQSTRRSRELASS